MLNSGILRSSVVGVIRYMYSIHLWYGIPIGIGGGYICPKYMCILLYVKHIQCSGIP